MENTKNSSEKPNEEASLKKILKLESSLFFQLSARQMEIDEIEQRMSRTRSKIRELYPSKISLLKEIFSAKIVEIRKLLGGKKKFSREDEDVLAAERILLEMVKNCGNFLPQTFVGDEIDYFISTLFDWKSYGLDKIQNASSREERREGEGFYSENMKRMIDPDSRELNFAKNESDRT